VSPEGEKESKEEAEEEEEEEEEGEEEKKKQKKKNKKRTQLQKMKTCQEKSTRSPSFIPNTARASAALDKGSCSARFWR
jgi:hypothetical protein